MKESSRMGRCMDMDDWFGLMATGTKVNSIWSARVVLVCGVGQLVIGTLGKNKAVSRKALVPWAGLAAGDMRVLLVRISGMDSE